MSLRSKLLWAQAPLVLAILINGILGYQVTLALGQGSQNILKDNYRSVLAAQRMNEAADHINEGLLMALSDKPDEGRAQVKSTIPRFESELTAQQNNITEPGEREVTVALAERWHEVHPSVDACLRLQDHVDAESLYFGQVLPRFRSIREATDGVLSINQDAMVRKSEHAHAEAVRYSGILLFLAVGGCVAAVLASSAVTTRLLRPLSVLGQAVRRIRQGDLAARAGLTGRDEIGLVAKEFNGMAARLQEYRDSSLGELIEAQQVAQAVIDSLDDPVLVVRLAGTVILSNRAAQAVIQVQDDVSGDSAYDAPSVLRQAFDKAMQYVQQKSQPYYPEALSEAVHVSTDAGIRAFLCRATPLRNGDGGLTGVTLVLQDVTRIVRFDELKNDLVATAAHELRTPLTSLQMSIHICIEQTVGPLNDKQSDLLYAARDDCDRLRGIVDELLDLSRMQSGRVSLRWELLDLASLVRTLIDTHRSLATQHHVSLRSEVLPASYAWMDGERVQMVLGNLVVNAIRYSQAESEILIRAFSQNEEQSLRVEVIDSGAGVAPEHREAIFEKYAQIPGHPGGAAGLGLFIAKETIEAHGGRIGVISREGGGSVFWFTLPREAPPSDTAGV